MLLRICLACFLFAIISIVSNSLEAKECAKPCGTLCCTLQETCMVSDPCMGDPACTSVPGFECVFFKLATDLLQAVEETNILIRDLRKESKFARPITSEIKSLLKEIVKALNLNKDACKEKGINAVVKLNATISKLPSKQCLQVKYRSRAFTKCIPPSVVEEFLPKLQSSHEKITAYFQIDGNTNLIPDLCEGFEATNNESSSSGGLTQTMKLSSPAFKDNDFIPIQYTCDNKNISPPLKFEVVPKNTKSLAILLDDPDAPGGTFIHWIIFNIPPGVTALIEDASKDPSAILSSGSELGVSSAMQGLNSFSTIGYSGPCPPSNETHRYIFKLFALDALLNLDNGITKEQFLSSIEGHILAQAELTGLYKR